MQHTIPQVTLDMIEQWLLTQPEGAIVGKAMQPHSCPISTMLKPSAPEGHYFSTLSDVIKLRQHHEYYDTVVATYDMPNDVCIFIRHIDRFQKDHPVTREQALKILAQARLIEESVYARR